MVGNCGSGVATCGTGAGSRGMLAQDPVATIAPRMMATSLEFMAGFEKGLLGSFGREDC